MQRTEALQGVCMAVLLNLLRRWESNCVFQLSATLEDYLDEKAYPRGSGSIDIL
jgi:hypothetical protein